MEGINIQKNKTKISKEPISPSNKIDFNTNNKSNLVNNTNQNILSFSFPDNSSEPDAVTSPIKYMNTSASSKPTIIEPLCKQEKFLPPLNILNQNKKTLVLDLDETLIHSYFDTPPPRLPHISFEILIEKKKIKVNSVLRPGVQEFLDNLEKYFEIVIFTASLSQYANPVIDFIDKKGICKYRLYREHCCCFTNGFANSFVKDLNKLDRDMKNLIIIDNNPKSFMLNKDNGIPIKTWLDDINDRELLKLIPYLLFLGTEKILDVRPFLKQVNSGNSLNYEKFDKIIAEFNIKKEREIEIELNNINIKNINQNIYDSINSNCNFTSKNIKKNKKKKKENSSNDKNKNNLEEMINKENNEKVIKKNINSNNDIIKENKNNEINNIKNDNNNNKETKNSNKTDNCDIPKEKENININNFIKHENKEVKNEISNSKKIINKNIKAKEDESKKQNDKNTNKTTDINIGKVDKKVVNINNKKETKKSDINLIKRNEISNNDLIDLNKRNSSVNDKNLIFRKFNDNNKLYKNKNKTTYEKEEINKIYEHSLKEEDLLIDEKDSFEAKEINNIINKNNDINYINKTSREMMLISLNKMKKDKSNFFLKKSSNMNIYKNKIRNESEIKTLKNLRSMQDNVNINSNIILNKSNQLSDQEKTIINDDTDEEEKNEEEKKVEEEPIFDDIDTEKEDSKNEKTKSVEKESINNNEINEKENDFEFNSINKEITKKNRKINKNLFNKGKINKYQLNLDKIKDKTNKLPVKGLFLNNKNKEKLNLKLNGKFEYSTNKKFSKDLFKYSTIRKRDSVQNNISSSKYKIFKEKEKPNLFLKNKSNVNNDSINYFLSKSKTKSISKYNSNFLELNNKYSKLNGTKTNKNQIYKLNKEKNSINFSVNNLENCILKSSGLMKRPTSCVNKKHEGINNNNNNSSNNKIERNKKIIRFTKQDKKIYLKTNNDKNSNNIKKAKINIENINNIGINLVNDIKNENEESKDDNSININNMNQKSPIRNIITDIFFVKNLEEKNPNQTQTPNTKVFNNLCEFKDENEKNKLIENYKKAILL